MPAKLAKGLQLFGHGVAFDRQPHLAEIESEDSVNGGADRAGVVAISTQAYPEIEGNVAGTCEIAASIAIQVHRSHVECIKFIPNRRVFARVVHDDVFRKPGEHAPDFLPISIGTERDSGAGRTRSLEFPDDLYDFEKTWMKRRFPSLDLDLFPRSILVDAFSYEFLHLLNGHRLVGRRLPTGPVAIEALQIASVGYVQRYDPVIELVSLK